jgi:hypothetical protein
MTTRCDRQRDCPGLASSFTAPPTAQPAIDDAQGMPDGPAPYWRHLAAWARHL